MPSHDQLPHVQLLFFSQTQGGKVKFCGGGGVIGGGGGVPVVLHVVKQKGGAPDPPFPFVVEHDS